MLDGMIQLKDVCKQIPDLRYATLLYHVNKGRFPEAKLIRGTRWYLPLKTVEKLKNNEINLSSINRDKKVKNESELEKQIREILKKRRAMG